MDRFGVSSKTIVLVLKIPTGMAIAVSLVLLDRSGLHPNKNVAVPSTSIGMASAVFLAQEEDSGTNL